MPCLCENCGEATECGEKYCAECFVEIECEDDVERNLYAGGRFYGEDLVKEDNKTDANT